VKKTFTNRFAEVVTARLPKKNEYFNDNDDGKFVKPELRNMLTFFCEHGRMSDSKTFDPLEDIKYIDEVEELCNDYAKITGHTAEDWHKKRNPYVSYHRFSAWLKTRSGGNSSSVNAKKENDDE